MPNIDLGDASPFFKAMQEMHPGFEVVDVHFTLSSDAEEAFSPDFFEELAAAVRNSEPFSPDTEF